MRATKFLLSTSVAAASESAKKPHPTLEQLDPLCKAGPRESIKIDEHDISCRRDFGHGGRRLIVTSTSATGTNSEPLPAECFNPADFSLMQCNWFGQTTPSETADHKESAPPVEPPAKETSSEAVVAVEAPGEADKDSAPTKFLQQMQNAAGATKEAAIQAFDATKEAAIQAVDAAKPVAGAAVHKAKSGAKKAVGAAKTVMEEHVTPALKNAGSHVADGAKKIANSMEEEPDSWKRAGLISVLLILLAAVLAYLITKE